MEPELPDIARLETPFAKIVHCVLPPWRDGEFESVSNPGSIGIAFTPQSGAVVRRGNGRASRRDVLAYSVGLGGHEPISWLDVGNRSDIVEITASPALRREIAEELRVPQHADLDDIDNWRDPVICAIAPRFRAGIRGWRPFDDLECEMLTRAAYVQVLHRKFGGRVRGVGTLGAARLDAVITFIRANLYRELSLAELAEAAALSPYHFARSFQRSTGLPPHRFVTTLRLELAAELLKRSSRTVEQVAEEVGFANLSHFRRIFRAQFGCSPAALR
jgi:AraC family transcriptional regulator